MAQQTITIEQAVKIVFFILKNLTNYMQGILFSYKIQFLTNYSTVTDFARFLG